MNCPVCDSKLIKGAEPYFFNGINLGKFDAEKCIKCNEVFFTEKASDEIDKKAKELGLWGMNQKTTVGYSGNSIIVRIPKKISDFIGLKRGKTVEIRPEGKNRLVIEA